jgi:hypothetical protein
MLHVNQNSEVAPRFSENLCTPLTQSLPVILEQSPRQAEFKIPRPERIADYLLRTVLRDVMQTTVFK